MASVIDPLGGRSRRKLGIAVDAHGLYPLRLIDAQTGDVIEDVASLSIVSEVDSIMKVRVELFFKDGMLIKV